MHPNGQLPAYEFAFGDVNPPVHAWAAWRVYKIAGAARRSATARSWSACFQKLLINFTWWVNRKDAEGDNLFSGGFLGLDNIGVFDRSQPLPGGGRLEQADGTAWMAFYCATMLAMALELARDDPAYEDIASKFFEHFVAIADAMNTLGGNGLWDERGRLLLRPAAASTAARSPLRVRSMVGLDAAVRRRGARGRGDRRAARASSKRHAVVPREPARARAAHRVHGAATAGTHAPRCSRSRPASGSCACCATCSTRASSCRRTACARCRACTATHPYVLALDGEEYAVDYVPGESTAGCSAATRTGAGRCGSRSTIC